MDKEMSQEEMVKEAVEEAKKAAQAAEEAPDTSAGTEENESADSQDESTEAAGDADVTADEAEEEDADVSDESDAESDADASDDADADSDEKKEKKIFGRKNKKDKRDEQIADLTDKLTRQMAEFDNFRKRTDKEKAQMYEIGARDVIEKILPVIDNFERGLQGVPEESKEDPFIQGMDKIYKQMLTIFEGLGVKPIEALGQEFNPDLHNAVMHVEDEEAGENIIVEEFQKGYMYRDTVVRHSMVKVAN